MNGHTIPILVAILAALTGLAVPAESAPQSLSIVVGILTFIVLDLRRESSKQKDRMAWLVGAVETIAPAVNVRLNPFKPVND